MSLTLAHQRRFVAVLVVALGLAACGGSAAGTTSSTTPTTTVAPTGAFDVAGHSLYLRCLGAGSPTIILETGEGGVVEDVAGIQQTLSERSLTCAYDRANNGLSDDGVPTPRTAADVVEDLHALLTVAGVPGPYLVIGQSAGGMFVQLFARTYPAEVVGVVAINPVPPADPWLDEVRAVFTEAQYAEEEAYYRGANGESLDYSASSQQIIDTATPDAVFLEMVLSTNLQCEGAEICLVSYGIYEQSLKDLTASWPHGMYAQVAALHDIIRDDPAAVLEAVDRILAATG